MQNEWILDVLSDLRAFARQNGMSGLAEHLDDTRLVALAEMASNGEGMPTHGKRATASAGILTKHS